jgi:hypothetical protein
MPLLFFERDHSCDPVSRLHFRFTQEGYFKFMEKFGPVTGSDENQRDVTVLVSV